MKGCTIVRVIVLSIEKGKKKRKKKKAVIIIILVYDPRYSW